MMSVQQTQCGVLLVLIMMHHCPVVWSICSPENIPSPFMNISNHHLDLGGRLEAIIPEYTFRCYGNVTMWGACVRPWDGLREIYVIYFEVFRPTPLAGEGCYDFIGFNAIQRTLGDGTDLEGCLLLKNIPSEKQVQVEPGDVVGFYAFHVPVDESEGGVQLDESRTDVTVWYKQGTRGGHYCIGTEGDLNTSENHPPVITANVQESTPLQSTPIPSSSTSSSPSSTSSTSSSTSSTSTSSTSTSSSLSMSVTSSPLQSQLQPDTLPSPSQSRLQADTLSTVTSLQIQSLAIKSSSSTANPTPPSPTITRPGSDGDGESPAVFAAVAVAFALILAAACTAVTVAVLVFARKKRKANKPQPPRVSVNNSYGVTTHGHGHPTSLKNNPAYGTCSVTTKGNGVRGVTANQAAESSVYELIEDPDYMYDNDIKSHELEYYTYDNGIDITTNALEEPDYTYENEDVPNNKGYEYSYPRETTGWPIPQGRTPPQN